MVTFEKLHFLLVLWQQASNMDHPNQTPLMKHLSIEVCQKYSVSCHLSSQQWCLSNHYLQKWCYLKTKFTGCPRSKVSKVKGCSSETVHIWPHIGKAKMCLKDIHFCLQNQLFAHIKYKIIKNAILLQPSFHGLMVKD